MSKYEKIKFDDVEVFKGNKMMLDTETEPEQQALTEESFEEKEVEEFKPVMTEREVDKIKSTFTSMTEDEKQIVLSTVPSEKLWEELRRRNALYQNKIETFNEIMGVSLNTINPINDASWIGIVDRYTDVEVRFNEIARVMGV